MIEPLLMTKLSLPIVRQHLVRRNKLLKQLNEGVQDGHMLTLVSAPAGYGKTTTICTWLREARYAVAWVTLEQSDNDLKQFLTYCQGRLTFDPDRRWFLTHPRHSNLTHLTGSYCP